MTTATEAEWTPDADAIAALIPTRTGDASGEPIGEFTTETVPTQEQVEGIIAQVVADVAGYIGPVPTELITMATSTVTYGAASLVELTFYPDHGMSTYAPADRLRDWYDKALKRLKTAVETVNAGQPVGGGDSPGPVYSFPDRSDSPTQASPLTSYAEHW